MEYELRIAGKFHKELHRHLFPGDGKEAVAIMLCGRHETPAVSILLSHKILLIPHGACERKHDRITWKTDFMIPFLEEVEKRNFALVKIHSHPGGYDRFSRIDDVSDVEFLTTTFNWSETQSIHGSAVMLPDGRIFGRALKPDGTMVEFDKISVAGDRIRIWPGSVSAMVAEREDDAASIRNRQTFGEGTYAILRGLRIGVVGCSGTGSPTIEQLYRLGVGELVIIDPKKVEKKNLNRILHVTMAVAEKGRYKSDALAEAIRAASLGTTVTSLSVNLFESKAALEALIRCHIIISCVDSAECRQLLCQLANFYILPYLDMGVALDADGKGGIASISAMAHYIQPGLSTLLSRESYTAELLEAEGLLRQDPKEFAKRVKAGYIRNVTVERPAVMPINMLISSMAIMDLLNRLHEPPFKEDSPAEYARILIDYSANCIENRSEDKFAVDEYQSRFTGRGDCKPFLRMSELDKL